jgi:hypothetical protein
MKLVQIIITLVFLFITEACKNEDAANNKQGEVMYNVTFEFHWSAENFPDNYPSNDHFSPIVGWTHKTSTDYFQPGTLASDGIELMAETGATQTLLNELDANIYNNEGLYTVLGSGLGSGVGTISVDVLVDADYPAVTLVTMLAPSPDWYVGIINVNLLEDNRFVDSKVIDGILYDAGTDSGVDYTSPNSNTNPQESISLLVDAPFGDGNSINTAIALVTITKKN